jgi:acyl carrier protein
MSNIEGITRAVHRTIASVNELLPAEQTIGGNEDAVLLGRGAQLDSLGFVNFIVALEEELEAELGRGVNMADLLSVQSDADATSTVGDLIRVLAQRLA